MNKSVFALLLGIILGGAIVLGVLNVTYKPANTESLNINDTIVTYPKSEEQVENVDADKLGDVTILWPDKKCNVKNGDKITFIVTVTGQKELSRYDVNHEFLTCQSIKKISDSTYEVTGMICAMSPTSFEYSIGNSNGVPLIISFS